LDGKADFQAITPKAIDAEQPYLAQDHAIDRPVGSPAPEPIGGADGHIAFYKVHRTGARKMDLRPSQRLAVRKCGHGRPAPFERAVGFDLFDVK
jgi:hypothetical protein